MTVVEMAESIKDAVADLEVPYAEIDRREARLEERYAQAYVTLPRGTVEERLRALDAVEEYERQSKLEWEVRQMEWQRENCQCSTCFIIFQTKDDLAAHERGKFCQ